MSFQTEDFSNVRSIGEINRVCGLDINTPITRSLRRYRECSINHVVEDGNDLTDRVVSRRNRYLFVIGVGDHIRKIHIVEHDLIGCEQDSHGNDVRILELKQIDPGERAITR